MSNENKMFYSLQEPITLNGIKEFVDLTDYMQEFLQHDTIGLSIKFSSNCPNYMTILGIYFKESWLPDFSININKGYLAITTKQNGRNIVMTSSVAYCDGEKHHLIVNGDNDGLRVYMDGGIVFDCPDIVPYCSYEYIGFVTIGRKALEDDYNGFFNGTIYEFDCYRNAVEVPKCKPLPALEKIQLFKRGMAGSINYRIPNLVTTKSGTTIAAADARYDACGDSPNHIMKAIRRKKLNQPWSDVSLLLDFGGYGRIDGASAIDGSLLADNENGRVFMLYNHSPASIGGGQACLGTGFDDKGRRIIMHRDGARLFIEADGTVTDNDGKKTTLTVDKMDRIYDNGKAIGSVCQPKEREYYITPTCYLQIVHSDDEGETWSEPKDLNFMVKEPWMSFINPGPGCGIQVLSGKYQGRLVFPLYYSNGTLEGSSAGAMYSDDHGETWIRGASVNDCRKFLGKQLSAKTVNSDSTNMGESQIIELPDGTLRIFMRNIYYKRVCVADSHDGGQTWCNFHPIEKLLDSYCQSSVIRAQHNGKPFYLFANAAVTKMRIYGKVRYSIDGENWSDGRLVDGGVFSYSSLTQYPDGSFGILYEGQDLINYLVNFDYEWLTKQ